LTHTFTSSNGTATNASQRAGHISAPAKTPDTPSKPGAATSIPKTPDLAATSPTAANYVHDATAKRENRTVAGCGTFAVIDTGFHVSLKIRNCEGRRISIGREDLWTNKAIPIRTGRRIRGDMDGVEGRRGDTSCVSCATIECVRYVGLGDISRRIGGCCMIGIDLETILLLPTIRSGSLDRYLRNSSFMLDPIWGFRIQSISSALHHASNLGRYSPST
jgi:hypothetical protein